MLKKLTAFIIGIAIMLSFSSCNQIPKRYEVDFFDLFDTFTKVVLYSKSEREFKKNSEFIEEELTKYHKYYDIYNEYDEINNLKTINDNAGISPVFVSSEIIDLLLFSKEMYEKTDGKINIAMGSVLSIWHEYRTEGMDDEKKAALPPMNELKEAALHTDIDKLIIDEKASTVYLDDTKMSLDAGSIGKGYAVEQTAQAVELKGATSALISVGGNVRTIGKKGDNSGDWSIGVQDPENQSRILYTLNMQDNSLVTSGVYQRYYTVNGEKYHHIIDPQTLMPSAYFAAVTILCNNSGMADALSTALFNMPTEQGKAIIESLDNTEAVWILNDKSEIYSSGFKRYMTADE